MAKWERGYQVDGRGFPLLNQGFVSGCPEVKVDGRLPGPGQARSTPSQSTCVVFGCIFGGKKRSVFHVEIPPFLVDG